MLSNHVKLMDKQLREFAKARYANDIQKAHETFYDHFTQQPNAIGDSKGRHQCLNIDKYIELPYHTHILADIRKECGGDPSTTPPLNISAYETSSYLTELTWVYSKIKATKSVHYLLNDLHLLSADQLAKCKHSTMLKSFLENNIRPINYDADQFYPLFKKFVVSSMAGDATVANDSVCQQWLADLEHIPISHLENAVGDVDTAVQEDEGATAVTGNVGYDYLANLGGNGYFVASINTEREEICVWNVST